MAGTLERGAGLLLPISSLPSEYGIGTLGKDARDFIDFLAASRQKYWQVLPVGPTSYGDSPYQSFSAFMGNPYYIDLMELAYDGLLEEEEIREPVWEYRPDRAAYDILYRERYPLLRLAADRYWRECESGRREPLPLPEFAQRPFGKMELEDYCLYMACKTKFGGKPWWDWPEPIRRREPRALGEYRKELAGEMKFWEFCQIEFFRQWGQLRAYAKERGIRLIGDLPIYVAYDSTDVWASPEQFQLDADLNPTEVAGVPPDYFSETGQLWGNPLYDWDFMERENYRWWRERIRCSAELYDVLRIDHFIGMSSYYAIPFGAEDAREGRRRRGPGVRLTRAINEAAGEAVIVAEDLGVELDSVKELLAVNGYPNMKVLEFGFDGGPENIHAPHNYQPNCLVYLGTHDNETLAGFLAGRDDWQLAYAYEYFGVHDRESLRQAMIRCAYSSVAKVTILQVQDLLGLDNSARMNEPSTLGKNWQWRLLPDQLGEAEFRILERYTTLYGR